MAPWHWSIFFKTMMAIFIMQICGWGLYATLTPHRIQASALRETRGLYGMMNGHSLATAATVASIFKGNQQTEFWIERQDGSILLRSSRRPLPALDLPLTAHNTPRLDPVQIHRIGILGADLLTSVPLQLSGETVFLRVLFHNIFDPVLTHVMTQIAISIVAGVIISYWLALRVARPLEALRDDVLTIAAGNLTHRIPSVSAIHEIADVARSVNALTDKLVRMMQSVRELAATISHEIRSPLARMNVSLAIVEQCLYASGAADEADAVARQLAAKHIEALQHELQFVDRLVGATLLSSRLDLQQRPSHLEHIDLSGMVHGMIKRYASLIQQQELRFTRDIEPHVQIMGEEDLLIIMLSNLLDNAVKYTAPGGEVSITLHSGECIHTPIPMADLTDECIKPAPEMLLCSLAGQNSDNAPANAAGRAANSLWTQTEPTVLLHICNACPSITPQAMERLFEPFYRTQSAAGSATFMPGVGLGLALVRQIVVLHGGAVWASHSPQGLMLTVRLVQANVT